MSVLINKRNLLRKELFYRTVVIVVSTLLFVLNLIFYSLYDVDEVITGAVTGVCTSAFVWSVIDLYVFLNRCCIKYHDESVKVYSSVSVYVNKLDKFYTNHWSEEHYTKETKEELIDIISSMKLELHSITIISEIYPLSNEFKDMYLFVSRIYWKCHYCFMAGNVGTLEFNKFMISIDEQSTPVISLGFDDLEHRTIMEKAKSIDWTGDFTIDDSEFMTSEENCIFESIVNFKKKLIKLRFVEIFDTISKNVDMQYTKRMIIKLAMNDNKYYEDYGCK